MKTIITLTIEHKKPIPDLLDKVAGRVYTMAGGDGDVTAVFSGWQPIETAPKDGTFILIAHKHDMAVAFSDPENEGAWTMDDGHDYLPCLRRNLANPTHWMPRPEVPQ